MIVVTFICDNIITDSYALLYVSVGQSSEKYLFRLIW